MVVGADSGVASMGGELIRHPTIAAGEMDGRAPC